tara:strand:- start:177 stop:908 length:732 start_codon:yes stop_codon:yes gene_type:complete
MIKFFRKIRQKLLTENKLRKYLIYAIGEIILVVIGILIALQINNWNTQRIEVNSDYQLVNALITDLKLKNEEVLSDLDYGKSMIQNTENIINYWSKTNKIDTLNLKYSINKLGEDSWFYNEKSPVLDGLTNSDLWKRLPDSLIRQIDNVYRVELARVKTSFEKSVEYATHCKLNFLIPNGLTNPNIKTLEVFSIVSKNDKEFISNLEVFRGGVFRLNGTFGNTSKSIDELIKNLNIYQSEEKK